MFIHSNAMFLQYSPINKTWKQEKQCKQNSAKIREEASVAKTVKCFSKNSG